jgi:hypothetical protein
MRKLWVKAWITLDGVFDADTMDHWWQNTNSPERMRYITEEYANGDAYLLGRVTYRHRHRLAERPNQPCACPTRL